MKTSLLLLILLAASAAPAMAQGRSYQFDNFDISNGVHIQLPVQPDFSKSAKRRHSANWSAPAAGSNPIGSLTTATSMSVGRSLDGFTTGNSQVDSFIAESGARHGVDPVLLYAIMHQESTFKAKAVSPKGARGLMQLMPGTAARYGVIDIFDPRQNIEGGARYMKFLLNLFNGDVSLALAGYNAGEGAVMKYGYRVPPYSETQEYVRRISRRYALMRDPLTALSANSVSRDQVASMRGKEATPLSIYEPQVYAVRLPDGRLQLMSQ